LVPLVVFVELSAKGAAVVVRVGGVVAFNGLGVMEDKLLELALEGANVVGEVVVLPVELVTEGAAVRDVGANVGHTGQIVVAHGTEVIGTAVVGTGGAGVNGIVLFGHSLSQYSAASRSRAFPPGTPYQSNRSSRFLSPTTSPNAITDKRKRNKASHTALSHCCSQA
jgi:hypothetical protein